MKKPDQLDFFKNSLRGIYPLQYNSILDSMNQSKPTTFRVNKTKSKNIDVISILKKDGFNINNGPLENSYIVKNSLEDKYISDTDVYKNGLIYLQELSSMIPPILLHPKSNEKILDMASSPGSKTTQLADLANNKAEILAIEKHPIRIKTLHYNINHQSSKDVTVLEGNGIKFDKRNPQFCNFFDKVLVDAPCSSEGRFNLSNYKTYKYWSINKRKEMSKAQKGLLISGYRMLKPGGLLAYSTCTFGLEENEMVLDWFLQKYPEAKLKNINLPIKNIKNGIITWNGKNYNPQISKSIRIIPDKLFTGFFVALIEKPYV